MATRPHHHDFREDYAEAHITIWKETLFAADILVLHSSPVYYGLGVPRGDGSAVVVVPGFPAPTPTSPNSIPGSAALDTALISQASGLMQRVPIC